MDVHVDQTRHQRLARQVDVRDLCRPAHRAGVCNRRDPSVLTHEDRWMFDIAATADIEHALGGDDGVLGQNRRGKRGCGKYGGKQAGNRRGAHGIS